MIKPELINSLKHYSLKTFLADFSSGIIVGIVALPLAIAFAIASGVSPEAGLFTAIVAGLCISVFGGSKVQIGGPTGAFAVIVYGVVEQFGLSGLATATIMAGVILILLGIFKMGGLIKFIPYTIITGFTAGIAVTIFAGQIGDFLGLNISVFPEGFEKMPGTFVGKIQTYALNITHINGYSFIMAALCLIVIFVWPHFGKKVTSKVPASLVVILLATLASVLLSKYAGLTTDTIGSRYGEIPSKLPAPKLPDFHIQTIVKLFPTSISIAVLAAIESLLSAVVADGMTGSKHDSNTELVAQGIANIASPLFGGIPATGAIARTATNIKNGGKTPVAGIVHALTLLLIMLLLGKYVVYIPMCALAAVLVSVSWNMAGFPAIRALTKGQKSDFFVFLATFLITIFVDLTVAIAVGLGLAAFFFIKKMIDLSEVQNSRESLTGGIEKTHNDVQEAALNIPEGVMVYEIEGPLFFGTVRKFEMAVDKAYVDYKVLVLRMRKMIYLDAGGIRALEQAKQLCDKKGVKIVLSGIHTQPYLLCEKTGMADKLGRENICENIDLALVRARELLEESKNLKQPVKA